MLLVLFSLVSAQSCTSSCLLFDSRDACFSPTAQKLQCTWCQSALSRNEFCFSQNGCKLPEFVLASTPRDFPVNNCTLVQTCNGCIQANGQEGVNCGWCSPSFGSQNSMSYCSTQTQCNGLWNFANQCQTESPTVAPTPAPYDSLETARRCSFFNADCAYCKSANPNCGYCQTTVGVNSCTTKEYCRYPWIFNGINDTCPTTVTTVTTVTTFPKTTTSTTSSSVTTESTKDIVYRCRELNQCGSCNRKHGCSWCPATETCIGADDVESTNDCILQNEGVLNVTTTCTCEGWSDCNDCRVKGCTWCSTIEKSFCFDTNNMVKLQKCQDVDGYIQSICPFRNETAFNNVQKFDAVVQNTKSQEKMDNDSWNKVIAGLLIGFGIVGTVLFLAIVGYKMKQKFVHKNSNHVPMRRMV